MTSLTPTNQPGISRGRDVAGWLGLAASPAFGLMALIVAIGAPRFPVCVWAAPIDGMAWMYLLMSLFHVSPWLRLATAHPHRKTEGD